MGSKSKSKAKGNKKKQAKPHIKNLNEVPAAEAVAVATLAEDRAETKEKAIDSSKTFLPAISSKPASSALEIESQTPGVPEIEGGNAQTSPETSEAVKESVNKPADSTIPKLEGSDTTLGEELATLETTLDEQSQDKAEEPLVCSLADISLQADTAPKAQQFDIENTKVDKTVDVEAVDNISRAKHIPEDTFESTRLQETTNETQKEEVSRLSGSSSHYHQEKIGFKTSALHQDTLDTASGTANALFESEVNNPDTSPVDLDVEDYYFYSSLNQTKGEQSINEGSPNDFVSTNEPSTPHNQPESVSPGHSDSLAGNESVISPIGNEPVVEKHTNTKSECSTSEDDGDDDFFKALTSNQKQPELGDQEVNAEPSFGTAEHDGLQLDFDDDDGFLDDDDDLNEPTFIEHIVADLTNGDTANRDAAALSFLDSDEDFLPGDEEPALQNLGQQPLANTQPPSVGSRPSIAEFHTEQKSFDLPMEIMPQQKARHQAPMVISRTKTTQIPGPSSSHAYSSVSKDILLPVNTASRPPPAFARPVRSPRAAGTKSKYAPPKPAPGIKTHVPSPLNHLPLNTFSQSAIISHLDLQSSQPLIPPQIPSQLIPPEQFSSQQQKKKVFVRPSNPDPFGFPDLPSATIPRRVVRAAPSRESLTSSTPPIGSHQSVAPPGERLTPGITPPSSSVRPGFPPNPRKPSASLRANSSVGVNPNYVNEPVSSGASHMPNRAQNLSNAYAPDSATVQSSSPMPFSPQDQLPSGSFHSATNTESPHQSNSAMNFAPPSRENGTRAATPQPLFDPAAPYSSKQQPITDGTEPCSNGAPPPASTISKLPLPLLGPKGLLKNKSKDIDKWIDERTGQLGLSTGSLLYRLMQHLMSSNQAERGQMIRDTLQDYRKDVSFASFDAQPNLTSEEVTSIIFGKLVAQDRTQALQAALDYRAYSHALLIAKSLGSDQWQTAVEEFVAEEARKAAAPLAFIYRALAADTVEAGESAISELKPRGETSHLDVNKVDAQLVHWAGCASALYDSVASSGENSPATAALKELGKLLVQRNFIEEGHVCFVICKVPLGSLPDFSLPLATEQQTPAFDSYVLAEIYESILGRGSPALLPRKLEFATTLAGMGHNAEALRIAETVAQVLKATKGAPQPLLDSAQTLVDQCSATASPSGGWLNRKLSKPQLSKAFNKFVSGDDDEAPPLSAQSMDRRFSQDSGVPSANRGFVPPPRQSFTPGPDHRSASPSLAVHHNRPKSSATSRQTALTNVAEEHGSQGELNCLPHSAYAPSFAQKPLLHHSNQRLASPYTDSNMLQYSQGPSPYAPMRENSVSAQPLNDPLRMSPAPQGPLQSSAFAEPAQAPSLYQTDAQAPALMMPPPAKIPANSVFMDPSSSMFNTQYPPGQEAYNQQDFTYLQTGHSPPAEQNYTNPYSVVPSPSLSPHMAVTGQKAEPSGQNLGFATTPQSTQPNPAHATKKYDPVCSQSEKVPTAQNRMAQTEQASEEKSSADAPNEAGKKETPQEDGTKKKGWFSWLKKEDSTVNKPIEVKLGGSTQMYFDKELGRWVSKDGPKPEAKKGPPPPPKAATVSSPAMNTAPHGGAVSFAPSKPLNTNALGGVPQGVPSGGPAEMTQAPSPSVYPPAATTVSTASGIDGILAVATAGKGKRRPARNRYVGTSANGMPQGL